MEIREKIIRELESGRFANISAAEGLKFLFELLSGHHKYSEPHVPVEEYYFQKHPFTGEEPVWVVLIGWPGVTASIGPFVKRLVKDFGLGIPETYMLTIFLCESAPNSKQYQIYFQDGWGNLCGGCTNYSGEGGKGTKLMVSLFLLLNEVFGVPIEIKKVDYKTWKAGEELIREAQKA